MTLKVKYADLPQITRSRTIDEGVPDVAEFAVVASALLEPLFPVEKGIRLLSVTLSSLEAQGDQPAVRQLSLGLPGL